MEEPRRYRTRSHAKAEADPNLSGSTSSARSSTRSTASSSSSTLSKAKSTTGKRGRPRKNDLVDELSTSISEKTAAKTRGAPKRKAPAARASSLDSSRAKRGPVPKSLEEPARRPLESVEEVTSLPTPKASFLQTPAKRARPPGALEGSTIKVSAS